MTSSCLDESVNSTYSQNNCTNQQEEDQYDFNFDNNEDKDIVEWRKT